MKFRNYIIHTLLCLLLFGCNESSNTHTNQVQQQATETIGLEIESVDIYRIYDNLQKKTDDETCFEGNSICITQGTEFAGQYVKIKDNYVWLTKDISGHFDVDIDTNKVRPGSLKVSELSANLNGNHAQGHIAELDDTSCNVDMDSDYDSCIIKLTYSADDPENNKTNEHLMQVVWLDKTGNEHAGIVKFTTYNLFKSNQSLPILSNNGSNMLSNLPNLIQQQDQDQAQLVVTNYIIGQLNLVNNGDDILSSANSIKPLVSANTHYFNLNDLSYYDIDEAGQGHIKCPSNNLPPGGLCSLNFTYKDYFTNDKYDSQVGRIAFKYKLDPSERDFYLYNNKYIISPGLFVMKNNSVDLHTGDIANVNVFLSRLYSLSRASDPTSISYRLPINNLKFSIEANDGVYIPYYFDKEHIYYSLGDENKKYLDLITIQTKQKELSPFESNGVNYLDSELYTAQIYRKESLKDKALFGGMLVATYYSPDLHKNIRQIIGSINITSTPGNNDRLCNKVWRDNEYEYFDGCQREIMNSPIDGHFGLVHYANDINIKIPLVGNKACTLTDTGYCANVGISVGIYSNEQDYVPSSPYYSNPHNWRSLATQAMYQSTVDNGNGTVTELACVQYDTDYPWYSHDPIWGNDKQLVTSYCFKSS